MEYGLAIGLILVFLALAGFSYAIWQFFKDSKSKKAASEEDPVKTRYHSYKNYRKDNPLPENTQPTVVRPNREGKTRRFNGEILPHIKWPDHTKEERLLILEEQKKLKAYKAGDPQHEIWK